MNADFKARHFKHTATITLNAPPEQVFPLFGPVREAEWAEGWDPQIIYAESPLAEEEGAVFVTQHDGQAETIWIVVRFDMDARLVEYARITPGATAVRVIVLCAAGDGGRTAAEVTYEVTMLAEGAHHPAEWHYVAMMAEWEAAINQALAGGRMPHGHG